ncbi:MAG TPA: hypothetical protein VKY74_14590 [Chloroflexia bacterium]|nr:hypothetical protein [Chloroflexia bacterium]
MHSSIKPTVQTAERGVRVASLLLVSLSVPALWLVLQACSPAARVARATGVSSQIGGLIIAAGLLPCLGLGVLCGGLILGWLWQHGPRLLRGTKLFALVALLILATILLLQLGVAALCPA